ncbi:MAG: DUF4412 domain-containing protein [Mariniphaga sp.]|nr:DUF4412 domain-containing protein [Mariniphaga sp.]MDD4425178.1 DUF4412 domain-containing protein [Mariniphaga sp.]
MNATIKVLLLALFVIGISQPANSQRLLKKLQEKVQEKVEEKVEDRVDQKIDQSIDKKLDQIEETIEIKDEKSSNPETKQNDRSKQQEQRMQGLLKGLGMSGDPVPIADNYSFNHLIEMYVESYNQKGEKESEGQFLTHLNPNSKSMAYEMISGDISTSGKGVFIIDAENGATIILSEENGEKTGLVYGMGAFFSSIGETYVEPELEETPETFLTSPNVKKTGRTKTIAGYKCEEYTYNDEESESEIWITQDLKMNTQDFFSTLFKTNLYSRGIPWGYMMETTSLDKETGEKSTMKVTRVDEKSNKHFKMADYKITNLGSFQMTPEEK